MKARSPVGVRWTIGNVSDLGFESLALSIRGAHRIFGDEARYAVCVNTVPPDQARRKVGAVPAQVQWIDATGLMPRWLRQRFDEAMGEGTGWKFAPLQAFPDAWELALDNDCILWELPEAVRRWLCDEAQSFVLAEDVRRCVGVFDQYCADVPRNSGIRGLPPGFDLEGGIRKLLDETQVTFTSELDEQGLQIALLERSGPVHVVRTEEVTICSPFWPQQPYLGTCGAHFVGLNARNLPWTWYERPATECVHENWARLSPQIHERINATPSRASHELA